MPRAWLALLLSALALAACGDDEAAQQPAAATAPEVAATSTPTTAATPPSTPERTATPMPPAGSADPSAPSATITPTPLPAEAPPQGEREPEAAPATGKERVVDIRIDGEGAHPPVSLVPADTPLVLRFRNDLPAVFHIDMHDADVEIVVPPRGRESVRLMNGLAAGEYEYQMGHLGSGLIRAR